jgi:toxin ParE1/3/4
LSSYRIGPKAVTDMTAIFDYTVDHWGWRQADAYVDKLSECFQLLADTPGLGRSSDLIASGIRRFEQGSHVVFYKEANSGIEILRVLHQSMLPTQQRLNPKEQ